jgi:hypothetical protein
MSWSTGKPIHDRLPAESGNWQGNPVVLWLTDFWDGLLTQTKGELDSPEDWLGTSEQIDRYFLDWVGIGLCGFGVIWDTRWTETQKRSVIKSFGTSVKRLSEEGLNALVTAILPGSRIQNSKPARADFAISDLSTVADPQDSSYQILVPTVEPRGSRSWRALERVLLRWAPLGISRVQHERLMADVSIVGDTVTLEKTFGYLEQ